MLTHDPIDLPVGPVNERVVATAMGDSLALYNPDDKAVVSLNAAGSAVWSLIDGKRSTAVIAEELRERFGFDAGTAATAVASTLSNLVRSGAIQASGLETIAADRPYSLHELKWHRQTQFSQAGIVFGVRSNSPEVCDLIDLIFAHSRVDPTTGPVGRDSHMMFSIIGYDDGGADRFDFLRSGTGVFGLERPVTGGDLEQVVFRAVVECSRLVVSLSDRFVVHAGALAQNGRVVATPAVSTGGKSTFSIAGTLAGLDYVSDDALLTSWENPGAVEAYSKPIWVTAWTQEALGIVPDDIAWRPDRYMRGLLRIEDLGGTVATGDLQLGDVVRLERRPGKPTIEPIGTDEVLSLLIANGRNQGREPERHVKHAIDLAGRVQGWVLASEHPKEGAELLVEHLARTSAPVDGTVVPAADSLVASGVASSASLPASATIALEPPRSRKHRRPAAPESETDSSWDIKPGDAIADGYTAWRLHETGPWFERWMAWDVDRWMPVWIRIIQRGSIDPQTVEALRRDSDHLRALTHPAIPRLFGRDLADTPPYVVTEFIEGMTIEQAVADEGPCDPVDCLYLGMELASALRYLHRQGLTYNNMSVSSVYMREGRALLTDFEHVVSGGDQQGDIRALAALMTHALEGRKRSRLSGDVPPKIAALVDRMRKVDADNDPLTAAEVLDQLAALVPAEEENLWPDWANPQADSAGEPLRPPAT